MRSPRSMKSLDGQSREETKCKSVAVAMGCALSGFDPRRTGSSADAPRLFGSRLKDPDAAPQFLECVGIGMRSPLGDSARSLALFLALSISLAPRVRAIAPPTRNIFGSPTVAAFAGGTRCACVCLCVEPASARAPLRAPGHLRRIGSWVRVWRLTTGRCRSDDESEVRGLQPVVVERRAGPRVSS